MTSRRRGRVRLENLEEGLGLVSKDRAQARRRIRRRGQEGIGRRLERLEGRERTSSDETEERKVVPMLRTRWHDDGYPPGDG